MCIRDRLSTVVNNGDVQRSTVSSLVVTLEGDVELDAGAINVLQRSDASGATGVVVGTSFTTALVGGNTVVTISFSGSLTRNSIGALVDGNYQLGIDGSRVRRAGTNVTMGQNYSYGDSAADGFYTYYGDSDGNRTIGSSDLLAFRQTFRRSTGIAGFNANLDYSDDGNIGSPDLLAFRQRFRRTLAFS